MPGMVVVFDTSVLIPLILRRSFSTRLWLRLEAAGWELAISPQIFSELHDKFTNKPSVRRWLKLSDQHIEDFLTKTLPNITVAVSGARQAHGAVPADPKDDMIIACALEAQADYIVTEDKHLLAVKKYQDVEIMTRSQFAAELDQLGIA